ncbi:uncharacterized protein [Typha angustifolia]|uniref:uncharacterized protein n=1 Tax=Typha angustifolia TaxID=59011 RepID=UPI003C2AC78B
MSTRRALLPSGFHFRPKERVLVGHYLRKKLVGEKFSPGLIPEIDLYSDHPKNFTSQFAPHNRYLEWYFFTSTNRKHERSSRPSREAGPGRWKSTQAKSDLKVNGLEATKQSFAYMEKTKEENEKQTDWLMDEYTIKNSSGSIKDPKKLHQWVACKVHLTPKARARIEAEVPAASRKGKAAAATEAEAEAEAEPWLSSSDEAFAQFGAINVSTSGQKPTTSNRQLQESRSNSHRVAHVQLLLPKKALVAPDQELRKRPHSTFSVVDDVDKGNCLIPEHVVDDDDDVFLLREAGLLDDDLAPKRTDRETFFSGCRAKRR